jgi:hypothetical protein
MKNRNLILIIIFITALFFSCKIQKVIQEKNPSFKITEASFLELVAGEQNEPSQIELTVFLNNLPENILFDSILFKGNMENRIRPQIQPNKNYTITVKFNKSKVEVSNYKSLNIDHNHAILFYTKEEKQYFYHLKNIIEKESIYQP